MQQTATQTTKNLKRCAGVCIGMKSSLETFLRQCSLQRLHCSLIKDTAAMPDTHPFKKLAMNEDALRTAIKRRHTTLQQTNSKSSRVFHIRSNNSADRPHSESKARPLPGCDESWGTGQQWRWQPQWRLQQRQR